VNQFNDVAKNTLDEWINFLKREEVKEGTKAKGLKEAKEKLSIMNLSPKEREEYDNYMDNERDNEDIMYSNFTAGELKKAMQIAKNCLKDGMSISKIAKLTGLTEDEIKNIE
jgi:predicted transposase/invertase (TIGR01784 family)